MNSKLCQTAEVELFRKLSLASEANSESFHRSRSKIEVFAKIVTKEKPFTIFAKTCIFNVWQDSEHVSEQASKVKNVSFLN